MLSEGRVQEEIICDICFVPLQHRISQNEHLLFTASTERLLGGDTEEAQGVSSG